MNPVISFVAIVSLLLALGAAGDRAKKQAGVNPSSGRQITPSKIALNHNETMVSDAAAVQPADAWSQWLTSIQTFFFTSSSTSVPRPKGGCDDDFGCGMNHNERMVRDTTLVQPANTWSQWLTKLQAFFFRSFSPTAPGPKGGCEDEFGCGTNHNETMVSDTALVQQTDHRSKWLTTIKTFFFTRFSTGTSGCNTYTCGGNHNETMVSDTTLVQRTDRWSKWLTTIQTLFFTRSSTGAPGACTYLQCGGNHNETMVRETNR